MDEPSAMNPVVSKPLSMAEQELKKELKKEKKQFTFERTRMAMERLQLAWVRMAITLMAIGFTIYKVLESVMEKGRPLLFGFIDGREIGLFLLLAGFVGLALATRQHVHQSTRLKKFYKNYPPSIALIQSVIILSFILFFFVVVLFRL